MQAIFLWVCVKRNYQKRVINKIVLDNLVCSIKVVIDILDIVLHKRVKGIHENILENCYT